MKGVVGPAVFEWDDVKAESNLRKHRLPFHVVIAVFADEHRVEIDVTRSVDGEIRRKVIGILDGRVITVVFTMRGSVCRLISARRSNSSEERRYGHGQARSNQSASADGV